MRKRLGRKLSMLLATALTVANVGALTPMTALAAYAVGWTIEDHSEDPATYVGESYDVVYGLDQNADEVFLAIATVGGTSAAPTYTIKEATSNPERYVVASNMIATEAGTVRYAVFSDDEVITELTGLTPIDTKDVVITSPVSAFSLEASSPIVWNDGADLTVRATVTGQVGLYNWDAHVYAADDEEFSTALDAKFTVGQPEDVDGSTATKQIFDVPVTTDSATAGDYVIKATVADKEAIIPFTVVGSIKITNGEYSASTVQGEDILYPEDVYELNAYLNRTKNNSDVLWKSSNEEVATVDENGKVTIVGYDPGSVFIYAANLGLGDDYTDAPAGAVFEITVSEATFSIDMAESTILVEDTAVITATYGSKDVSDTVEWSSNNESVATVDGNGVITAISAGTAVIQAEYGGVRAIKTVTVVEEAIAGPITIDYEIVADKSRVHTGETLQMALMADGEEYTGNVHWDVEQVLSFDDNGDGVYDSGTDILTDASISGTGLFSARTKPSLPAAPVTVIATFVDENGSVETRSFSVTVTGSSAYYWAAEVAEEGAFFEKDEEDAIYHAGLIVKDHISVTPYYDGRVITNGTWRIDSGASVRVNNGVITAIGAGNSVVKFGSDLDHSGEIEESEILTIDVEVVAEELRITSEDGRILEEGANLQLGAMFGRDDVTASSRIKWDSDNKAVATVDAKGKVTGKKRGAAEITATYYAVDGETPLGLPATIEIEVITIEEATEAALEATKAAEEAAQAATEAAEAATQASKAADENATPENIAAAKKAAEEATKAAQAATEAAEAAEDAAKACETNAEASKDAAAAAQVAAEAAETATTASKTATASATAAQKKIDDAAAKKAEEEKKAAEEAAKKDGSAPGAPAPVGNALKDADGNPTGFEVTNSEAGNAEVAYVGTAADLAKTGTLTIPKITKDQSGNTYKVTSVKKRALKGAKAKKVVFSENIKDFGEYIVKDSSIKTVVINVKKNAKIKSYKFRKGCFRTGKKLTVKVKSSSKETKATFTKKLDNKKFVIKSKTIWK